MTGYLPIYCSSREIAAVVVVLVHIGAYIYARLHSNCKDLKLRMERSLRRDQARDAQIFALTSSNERLAGQILSLVQKAELLEGQVTAARIELGKRDQEMGGLYRERAELTAGAHNWARYCASKENEIRMLKQSRQNLERNLWEQSQKILELNDRLSECHRRLKADSKKVQGIATISELAEEGILQAGSHATGATGITIFTDPGPGRDEPEDEVSLEETGKGALRARGTNSRWFGRAWRRKLDS